MKKPFVPFFAFLVLLILTILFSLDLSTSTIPGWHTVIFPTQFVWGFFIAIILLLATIGYWLLLRRTDKINWTLFVFHLLFTIPSVLFIILPSIFLDVSENNQNELIESISLRMKLIPTAWVLFIIGQILFLVYFFRAINSKKITT